jgi:hypothetical protein
MLFMKRFLFVLAFAACGFGCSSDQPGPGVEDDKFKTEAAFCAEWAEVACNDDVVSACNGSTDGCIDSQASACGVIVPYGYKATYAEDCLNAVEDAYADAELDAEELDVVLRLGGNCATLVDGGQDEGETCTSSFDCDGVNGYECVIKADETSGSCHVPVEAGGGEQCDESDVVCEEGFYCNGSDCLIRRDEMDACTGDAMCAAELRCDIAMGETEGVCEPRLANGQACTGNDECASGICIGATNKVCASNVVLTVESSLCDTLR